MKWNLWILSFKQGENNCGIQSRKLQPDAYSCIKSRFCTQKIQNAPYTTLPEINYIWAQENIDENLTEKFSNFFVDTTIIHWLFFHKNPKWSFPLRISSVNVTKSAGNCGFGHIYWRNPSWKTPFFVQWIQVSSCSLIKNELKDPE